MSEASPKLQEAWYLRIISPHSRTHVMGAGMSLTPGEASGWGGAYRVPSPVFPKKQPQSQKGFRSEAAWHSLCLSKREGWLGRGIVKHLLLSHTHRAVSTCVRPGQTDGDKRLGDAGLPPLFPSQEFPPKVKMCFSLLPACQEPGLGSGMPAPTPLSRPDQARA